MTNLLTIPQLAEKINVKPRTIRSWVEKRTIHFIKLPGGDIRFDPEKIDSWLSIRTVKPAKKSA
jgi:excisionase family DNA binding protein